MHETTEVDMRGTEWHEPVATAPVMRRLRTIGEGAGGREVVTEGVVATPAGMVAIEQRYDRLAQSATGSLAVVVDGVERRKVFRRAEAALSERTLIQEARAWGREVAR